ncbi:MAG: heme biosynthesis HemY N-terminal domain-containing protein [Alsobacter sp.]
MIRILVLIALLVALAFGSTWLAERPGGLVLTFEGRQIEMTLGVALGVIAAIVIGAMLLWTIARFVLRIPSLLSLGNRTRRRAKGFAAVSRGMVAVGAGDPRSARRHSADATRLLGDEEPLALLLKAQTAQMTGDRGSAEGAFRQMLDEPETRVLGLRGLFVEARRKGDIAAARAYAAEAARLAPSVSWAGEALLEYQCSEQDWGGALATLERASRSLDKAVLKRQRAVLLTADAMARSEREPDAALARAQEALKLSPDLVPAAVAAARLLSRRGDYRKASKTLEASWKLSPHPELAEAYVRVRPGDSTRDRTARAEKLHALRPHAPEGRMALAEAALAGRDFARVRSAVAPLLEGRPTVSVCLLMADLCELDHSQPGSVREWLARASRAPRDAAWIADGVISDTWSPVSPVTGRLDAFVWGTPVEQIVLSERDARRAERAAAAALPASDDVIADVDEPEVLLAAPEPEVEPAPLPEPDAPATPTAAAQPPVAAAPAPAPEPPAPPAPAPALSPAPASAPAPAPAATPAAAAPVIPAPAAAPADKALAAHGANGKAEAAAPAEVQAAPVLPEVPPPPPLRPIEAAAAAAEFRRRGVRPTPVVFPLPAAPDDPGPDGSEPQRSGRMGFLQ